MNGVVYIIGAGPGSPDLISLRGLRLLRQADMVVMDTLLPETYLDDLDVRGKEVHRIPTDAGNSQGRQDEMNRIVVDGAKRGLKVARLKGGDPFLFGRGWEEIACLDEHGVPWEMVPGISSAMAVPAGASVPLTVRPDSRSVAFVTARLAGGDANREIPRADTIVVMMGVKVLPSLVERMIKEGWSPDTPVCIIERGSQPGERQVKAPLSEIASVAKEAGIKPPAITVIGAGVGRPDLINRRRRILFLGNDPAPFRPLGNILHWPARSGLKPDRALPEHEVMFFTSPEEVQLVLDAFGEEAFQNEVWCSPGATAAKLESAGITFRAVHSPGEKQDI